MTDSLKYPDANTKAFLKLLTEHDGRLNAFVLAMVRNQVEADEIVQETRLRLWEQFEDYDVNKDFGVWARTIAYYQILTYRRRRSRDRSVYDQVFLDAIAQDVEAISPELERRKSALHKCLEKMESSKRSILLTYYQGNDSMRVMAEQAGKPVAAFSKMIQRTRNVLSRCVMERLEVES